MTTSHAFSDSYTPFALPRALSMEANGMSPSDFRATYSPTAGPLRLGSWESSPRNCGRYEFAATFALGDTIHSATISAFGPAEAMTSMLHDAGIHIEIMSFHQQPTDAGIMTLALLSCGDRQAWAMGTSDGAFESTARAIVAGANRLF